MAPLQKGPAPILQEQLRFTLASRSLSLFWQCCIFWARSMVILRICNSRCCLKGNLQSCLSFFFHSKDWFRMLEMIPSGPACRKKMWQFWCCRAANSHSLRGHQLHQNLQCLTSTIHTSVHCHWNERSASCQLEC